MDWNVANTTTVTSNLSLVTEPWNHSITVETWNKSMPGDSIGEVLTHHANQSAIGQALRAATFYVMPGIVLLGILGNVLSACVFYKSTHLRHSTASIYLTSLSISDSIFLVTLIAPWLEGIDINVYNANGPCQLFHYLANFSSILSPWLVLSFTVERFIAVRYPFQRNAICTRKRAKTIVFSLVLASAILNSYVPFFFHSTMEPEMGNMTICTFKPQYMHLADTINVADMVCALAIPCSLIITLNIQISRAISKSKRNANHAEEANMPQPCGHFTDHNCEAQPLQDIDADAYGRGCFSDTPSGQGATVILRPQVIRIHNSRRRAHSLLQQTNMLLMISTTFLVLHSPSYILRVFTWIWTASDPQFVNNPPGFLQALQEVFMLIYYLNFAINFLLYCVSGRNFRQAAATIYCKRNRCYRAATLTRNNTITNGNGPRNTVMYSHAAGSCVVTVVTTATDRRQRESS